MIAIATGKDNLDNVIKEKLQKESKIINYREYLPKGSFETIILSNNLDGAIDIEQLVFELRSNDVRIVYLTSEDNIEEISMCLKYGIYDIFLDPIDVEQIVKNIDNPYTFCDVAKLYKKYNFNISNTDVSIAAINQSNGNTADNKEIVIKDIEKNIVKNIEKETIIEKIILARQQTIAFWGYTGGMGTSTIAYETAKGISKDKNKVVILDLEEISGNISNLAKIENCNIQSIIRLIDNEELTLPILKSHIIKSGGIDYFTGITMKNFYKIKEKHLLTIMKLLKKEYPYIIISAGNGIHTSGTLVSFYEADKVVAVSKASKNDIIKTIEMINFICSKWEMDKENFSLLVNMLNLTSDIDTTIVKDICSENNLHFAGAINNKMSNIYNVTKGLMTQANVTTSEVVVKNTNAEKGGILNVFKSIKR